MFHNPKCLSCGAEISWYTIPFFSVDFCNPQCLENSHFGKPNKCIECGNEFLSSKQWNYLVCSNKCYQERWKKDQANLDFRKKEREEKERLKKLEHERITQDFIRKSRDEYFQQKKLQEQDEQIKQKLLQEKLDARPRCLYCDQQFTQISKRQKTCGELCKQYHKNVVKNKEWVLRDWKAIEESRSKQNRKNAAYLERKHVAKDEWTGKQYKSVRG